jgi:hypothetical protein
MAQPYSLSNTANGWFKEIYADNAEWLIKHSSLMTNLIGFEKKDAIGNAFNVSVNLTGANGVTYAGPTLDAFALEEAVAAENKNVQVQGYNIVNRAKIGYQAAASAMTSKQSFGSATKYLVKALLQETTSRLEEEFLYGQQGIGASIVQVAPVALGVITVTINAQDWSYIWVGKKNTKIQCYQAGVLVAGTTYFTVQSVNTVNRTVDLLETVAGEAATLAAALAALGVGVKIDYYFKGQFGNSMAGLQKILTNTGSLFGIDASQYELWSGNTVNVAGDLTFDAFQEGLAMASGKGGFMGKAIAFVSPNSWADLNGDQAALRQYDTSYKSSEGVNGFKALTFNAFNTEVEIYSHNLVKWGHAFMFPKDQVKRVGATDITFNNPLDYENQKFFLELGDNAGAEIRTYANQAIFMYGPAQGVFFNNITAP